MAPERAQAVEHDVLEIEVLRYEVTLDDLLTFARLTKTSLASSVLVATSAIIGISRRQGGHHVAQRVIDQGLAFECGGVELLPCQSAIDVPGQYGRRNRRRI